MKKIMSEDQLSIIENAIWEAQPHTVANGAVNAIKDHFGADDAEIYLADYRSYVPMSLYGERLGVMGINLPRVPDAAERERFAGIAAIVTRALKVADQHTDLYQRVKRRSRLTLPAEIQWGLLPAQACVCDE